MYIRLVSSGAAGCDVHTRELCVDCCKPFLRAVHGQRELYSAGSADNFDDLPQSVGSGGRLILEGRDKQTIRDSMENCPSCHLFNLMYGRTRS
jgi:hypothetical protein